MRPKHTTRATRRWFTALAITVTVLMLLWLGSEAAAPASAPPASAGTAEGFEASEYYQPYQTQLMWRIRAEKVEPQEGSKLLLTGMHLEVFHSNGLTGFVVQSPLCLYDYVVRTAGSTGRLDIASGDGRLLASGAGYEFNQNVMTLKITNGVDTVFRDVISLRSKP